VSGRRRKKPAAAAAAADVARFWGAELDEPIAPFIRPSTDPTALLRSLGPIPLTVQEKLAAAQLHAVYEKATQIATAVAAAADLVEADDA
jgi:hypothetical protein